MTLFALCLARWSCDDRNGCRNREWLIVEYKRPIVGLILIGNCSDFMKFMLAMLSCSLNVAEVDISRRLLLDCITWEQSANNLLYNSVISLSPFDFTIKTPTTLLAK